MLVAGFSANLTPLPQLLFVPSYCTAGHDLIKAGLDALEMITMFCNRKSLNWLQRQK
jgi:hypothetical protein